MKNSPGVAASLANLARATVYGWKRDDPDFAKAWDNAIEAGVDLVETRLIQRALKDSDSNAQFYLRARRPEIYGRRELLPTPTQNVDVRVSLEEHHQRLVRLGLPLPVIEGDYEEEDDENDRSEGA